MVYFVIAMALFSASAYRQGLQNLVEGLCGLRAWVDHWEVPTRGGISVARQRLGVEPLRPLFDAVARPMATPKTHGACYRGKRVDRPGRHGPSTIIRLALTSGSTQPNKRGKVQGCPPSG